MGKTNIRPPCKTERAILELYEMGITNPYEIAEITNYALSTIQSSISRYTDRRSKPKHNYKPPKKQTQEIIQELKKGRRLVDIAKEYGITRQRVHQIKSAWLED